MSHLGPNLSRKLAIISVAYLEANHGHAVEDQP